MSGIRVLIIDDHPIVRSGLRTLIDATPEMTVIGEAADAKEGIARAVELQPDVAIVDLALPGGGGLHAMREIHRSDPKIRLLALTGYDNPSHVSAAEEAGASAYLVKQAPAEELLRTISDLYNGLTPRPSQVVDAPVVLSVEPDGNSSPTLSQPEREVLTLLSMGNSNREIAEALCLSDTRVASHLADLRQKLGAETQDEIVKRAIDKGLQQPNDVGNSDG